MVFDIESILIASGYFGIFGLMIANGFISFPSSQFLYIFVGIFVTSGKLNLVLASLLGALGNTVGNIILYELARRKGLEYITTYKIFPLREVKKVQIAFEKKGAWFLFVAKLLPAIKVWAPIPAGLSKMNRALYIGIIFVSSWIWSLIFIGLGMVFGKSANFLGTYSLILIIVALVVVWLFYKYMNSKEVMSELEKSEN
ncbi:MAG: DedA family protein [bacterium]|nr:DedA family protein [bacterium]